MITAEKFKKYLHTKITEEELLECYDFLNYDAEHDCEFLPNLYSFFICTKHLGQKRHIEKMHMLCVKYLAKLNLSVNNLQALYLLEMNYYYEISVFSQCIFYGNALLDLKDASISYKVVAVNYVLTILISQKLYKEAYFYINLFETLLLDYELLPEEKVTYYLNLCDVYAQAKDVKSFNLTKPRVAEALKFVGNKNSIEKLNFCKRVHEIYQLAVIKELNESEKKAMSNDVAQIMLEIATQTVYKDEYSSIFIPIFSVIKEYVSEEQMVEYVSKIIDLELSLYNEIDLYTFVISEFNLDEIKYRSLFERYHQALTKHYVNMKLNRIYEISAELQAHNLRKEYAIMKDKYQIDPLTGCFNRGFLLEEAQHILQKNTAIIYLDIDALKFVNDNYGHHAGDILITTFSHIILNNIPTNATAIRYGGDEFVIIINNTTEEDVKKIVHTLYQKVSEITEIEGHNISLSFSSGAYMADGKTTLSRAVEYADESMYKDKNNGLKTCLYEKTN